MKIGVRQALRNVSRVAIADERPRVVRTCHESMAGRFRGCIASCLTVREDVTEARAAS